MLSAEQFLAFRIYRAGEFYVCVCVLPVHIYVVHRMWELFKWMTSLKESKAFPLYTLAASLVY